MKKSLFLSIVFTAVFFTACRSTQQPEEVVHGLSLQSLIQQGRYEDAKNSFYSNKNINDLDRFGNTALHVAAQMGSADMVSFLLLHGADPAIKDRSGNTAIHVALKNNQFEAVKVLAEDGKNIFLTDDPDTNEGIPARNVLDWAIELDKDELYNAIITPKSVLIKNKDGQTLVHYFVQKKNINAINKCIKTKINLSIQNNDGKTPLALALEDNQSVESTLIAAELIKAGSEPVRGDYEYFEDSVKIYNVNLRSATNNQTPLHIAVRKGHLGIVKYLVDCGASISVQDSTGKTPLHYAAMNGKTEIAQYLIENHANVNAQDSFGRTPISLQIPLESQKDIYGLLLTNNADILTKDVFGNTILHAAAEGEVNTVILNRLVKTGADINARNDSGETPLKLAVLSELTDQISFYIERGADIFALDRYEETPLKTAIEIAESTGKIELVKTLVTPVNIRSRDSEGDTPLSLAIKLHASMDVIRYFIDIGADINARDKSGNTLLHTAVLANYPEAGQMLIRSGSDIYSKNEIDYSPLKLALEKGGEVREWFLLPQVVKGSDGNGNTPLHYAAEWQYDDSIRYLTSHGGDVNKRNTSGETPLYFAVRNDAISTIKLIVEKGANPNAKDLVGNSPLHYCVQWNTMESAKTLISLGSVVDAKNYSGITPLALAASSNFSEMAVVLINSGADVNACDIKGKSIMMYAVQNRAKTVIPYLLAYGSNVNSQDIYGRNAYHEAAIIRDEAIISVLSEYGGNALSHDSYGKTPFSIVINQEYYLIQLVLGKNKKLKDTDGNNPIHAAVNCFASEEVLESLIADGYDINQRNSQGITPINAAIISKQNELAKILIRHNADPFITDNNGNCAVTLSFAPDAEDVLDELIAICGNMTDVQGDTILHYAARNGKADLISHIVSSGVDKRIKNNDGETAGDVARRWKNMSVIDYLN